MSTKVSRTVAATAIALSLGAIAPPVASAATNPSLTSTTTAAKPFGIGWGSYGSGSFAPGGFGSVQICFPLGSVIACI
ncbi:hypothetical protein [Nocardia sp. NPDC005366]|uniref:hypothetical protein n=1 Tax=Nocardia sp. NPDC005366 TaxID=3156878 RepID=UPI0033B9468F